MIKNDAENIRDSIARLIDECAKSGGKKVLVLRSAFLSENSDENYFVPEDEGLRLHQDAIEFIDAFGTHTLLPFSSIARVEIDEESAPTSKYGKVLQFRKRKN